MRILVVSNFYPPLSLGGYELGCRDVVEGLRARGHEAVVLASDYNATEPLLKQEAEADGHVRRHLKLTAAVPGGNESEIRFTALPELERHNQLVFQETCAAYQPDLVYFWNMALLSFSLVFLARRAGLPISFYVSEHWLSRWENDAWYSRSAPNIQYAENKFRAIATKMFLRGSARIRSIYLPARTEQPDLSHVQFCSQFLKNAALEAGKAVQSGKVIHWGIEPEKFPAPERNAMPTRLLYVGRVSEDKGVHTAIEALALLAHNHSHKNVSLSVVGACRDTAYLSRLEAIAAKGGVSDQVTFAGSLDRAELPRIYQEHDVLVFPSVWEEPFGITPLEAMCAGLVVVGTTTGGSAEIFQEGVNALTFPKEDAVKCAAQLARLCDEPNLFATLRHNAIQTVRDKFTLAGMVAQIEQALLEQVPGQQVPLLPRVGEGARG